MGKSLILGYSIGFGINLVIFWIVLQLTLAAWGSKKAKEHWVAVVNTPVMQLIKVKWLSAFLLCVMSFQLVMLLINLGLNWYAANL